MGNGIILTLEIIHNILFRVYHLAFVSEEEEPVEGGGNVYEILMRNLRF